MVADALNLTETGYRIPNVQEKIESLLILSTPELASKISNHFSPDVIIGQYTTISTMPNHNGRSRINIPDDVDDAKSWWSRIEQLGQTKAKCIHLIATRDILACILGHKIGLQSEDGVQIALRPDTFHVIQLPPKPYRAIVLLVNGNLC